MPKNEKGFATIVVSIVVAVIITLITLGYAGAMNRQQRQALNQVLNAQAYYASESGVNDVLADIVNNPTIGAQSNCGATRQIPDNNGSDVGASIRCTNIDPDPPFLYYQSIPTDSNSAQYIRFSGRTGVDRLRISWNPANNSNPTALPASPVSTPFYASSTGGTTPNWPSNVGALRMIMVPFQTNNNRQQIIDATSHYYLFPTNTATASSINQADATTVSANGPALINASCSSSAVTVTNAPLPCNAVIAGIPQSGEIVLVISSLYRANNVAIEAFAGATTPRPIENVQVLVDVTARGTDVLRRLNVRVPTRASVSPRPFPAIEASQDICKLAQYDSVNGFVNPCGS